MKIKPSNFINIISQRAQQYWTKKLIPTNKNSSIKCCINKQTIVFKTCGSNDYEATS